jgi:hypothetical protein
MRTKHGGSDGTQTHKGASPTRVELFYDAKQVLSTDFDYVTEKNGIMLFRRPKRFSKVCA